MTNENTVRKPLLAVVISLALLTTLLLLLANLTRTQANIEQVLVVIAGMTLMATFSAFQRFLDMGSEARVHFVAFNVDIVNQSLPTSENDASSRFGRMVPNELEITPTQLVGVDNALSLAKLRIDVEQELRRIARDQKVVLPERPLSPLVLSEHLFTRKILTANQHLALKEIVRVCNQGVHGAEIDNETAFSVVSAGEQLLQQLRSDHVF